MGAAESFIADLLIQQGINLLRFGAGVRGKVLAILQRMELELTARLVSGQISDLNRANSASLLKETSSTIQSYYDEINGVVGVKLIGASNSAASGVKQAIEGVFRVAVNANMPTPNVLEALAGDALIHGAPSALWWERQAADTAFRFANEVRQGVAQAETNSQIVARIVGGKNTTGVMDISRISASRLVQASVQTVANTARRMTLESNKDIVDGIQQVSTLDGHTSDICIAYSGAMWDMSYEPMGDTTLPYNGGTPRHWGAIPAGSMIMTSKGAIPIESVDVGDLVVTHKGRLRPVTATMRKPCDDGVVRVLDMGAGRVLRVTDEHPVLTAQRGWVRADAVRCGDQLFQHPAESKPVGALHVVVSATDDYPPCFNEREVFTSISFAPRGVAGAIKLNDDAISNKCKVANPTLVENKLAHKIYAGCGEDVGQFNLSFWLVNQLSFLSFKRSSNTSLRKIHRVVSEHASRAIGVMRMGFFGQTVSPMVLTTHPARCLDGCHCHSGSDLLGPNRDFVPLAPLRERGFPNRKFALDLPDGLPIQNMLQVDKCSDSGAVCKVDHWALLTVVDIGSVAHTKEVFNISVRDDETYISDGFVVHNCRSLEVPVLKSFKDMGIDLPEFPMSTRASNAGQVDANMTFQQFLESKDAAFQDELLGKGRAQLWRDGTITLQMLLDQSGNPLSLAQLTAKYVK